MHSLSLLLVAVAAVCATSRTPAPSPETVGQEEMGGAEPGAAFFQHYYLPHINIPQYNNADNEVLTSLKDDIIDREIERINNMQDSGLTLQRLIQNNYLIKLLNNRARPPIPYHETLNPRGSLGPLLPGVPKREYQPPIPPQIRMEPQTEAEPEPVEEDKEMEGEEDGRMAFALTPLDKGFFDRAPESTELVGPTTHNSEVLDVAAVAGINSQSQLEPIPQPLAQRTIRQNPNLSKTKNLIADHLDRLRAGVPEENASTEKPRSIHVMEASSADPAGSIYGVAIIAAVGTALTLAIGGLAFGWYTMSKKAKAAAEVDYPAYGVTGPTVDMSGDRKLAHSAHVYHYQHQKQQIIAMERNDLEQRNGSISDPESEEENEEGDYTVYECPGFATTGDMEVKNPLFSEDPTPATPGKCEIVKPQPKD